MGAMENLWLLVLPGLLGSERDDCVLSNNIKSLTFGTCVTGIGLSRVAVYKPKIIPLRGTTRARYGLDVYLRSVVRRHCQDSKSECSTV